MRGMLACIMFAAFPAWAADSPLDTSLPPSASTPCAECGVVRSVRAVVKELKTDAPVDARPSGLVASVPLGGGKMVGGSSSRIGKEAVPTNETWEVVVRYDDGRFRVLTLDHAPGVRQGDKVRIDTDGKIVLRGD